MLALALEACPGMDVLRTPLREVLFYARLGKAIEARRILGGAVSAALGSGTLKRTDASRIRRELEKAAYGEERVLRGQEAVNALRLMGYVKDG